MARNPKKKLGSRPYANYTDASLNEAILEIAEGNLTIISASKKFKIPYGTLYNKYHGQHTKVFGAPTVFTQAEELAFVKSFVKCGQWGYPLDLQDIRFFVKAYVDQVGRKVDRFVDNIPGNDWARSFLKRHVKDIGQRFASNITRSRSEVSRLTIEEYFNNLNTTLSNVLPSNIFNFDETNLSDDPGKKKYLFSRGIKYPERIINHSKSATSMMFCCSASGVLLPPYFIYRGECMWDTWTENGPKGYPCCNESCCRFGSAYNRTKHGWIDTPTFADWFKKSFLPHAKKLPGKKVILGDNLASHFNIEVISLCEENDISFVCLPKNATHLCQPLDVGLFRALKEAWRNKLTQYKLAHPSCKVVPKSEFASLVKITLEKMDSISDLNNEEESGIKRVILKGFEATGIYPFNPQKVLEKLPYDTNNVQEIVNDTLVAYLNEKRYPTQGLVGRPRKRTRLNIVPGESITARHFNEEDSETDNETDNLVDDNIVEDPVSDNENVFNTEEPPNYLVPNENIKIGSYVLVKVVSGRRKATEFKYVAKVIELNAEEMSFELLGMKSMDTSHQVFKTVDNDIFTAQLDDILAVLPEPNTLGTKERKRYKFNFSIDVYEG